MLTVAWRSHVCDAGECTRLGTIHVTPLNMDRMDVDLLFPNLQRPRSHTCDYVFTKGESTGQLCSKVVHPPYGPTNSHTHLGETFYFCSKKHLDSGVGRLKAERFGPFLRESYQPVENAFLVHVQAHLDKMQQKLQEQKAQFDAHYDVGMLWIETQRRNLQRITKMTRDNLIVKLMQASSTPGITKENLDALAKQYANEEFGKFLGSSDYKIMESQISLRLQITTPASNPQLPPTTQDGPISDLTSALTSSMTNLSLGSQ